MSDPDYICDYCSRSFTRKYNLQTHIENCHLNLSCHCEICDIGFGSPTGLLLHLSRGHNQFNQGFPQCDVCGRVFARRQNIINHMINVHLQTNSVFSCHLCDKTFTTERNMKRHLKLHNRDVASLTCDYCKRIFRKRHAMIVHMQSHEHISKGGMKCQLCERAYANDRDLRRHMKMSHKEKGIFKCKICPKEYTLNQSLRRHTKTVHLSENSEQYTCEYCYKVITGKENLDSHIAFYHKQIGLDIVGSSKYDHFCQSCNMFYKKEHLLRQHIKTTHTFQEFYEYCKESLIKSAEKLEKSKKMKKKCLYCCEYCIQVFSTVYELKYHMKYEHDKDYSLSTCNVCFQKFFSKETIEQHRKKCIRPYNANSCSFCDKLFSDVSSLDFHTRIFHPQSQVADSNITSTLEEANETCHKCTHCERIYYTGRSLKHHLKLKHTADEPVKCKLCEKICNNKYYLASHMKVVHNNTYSSKCDYCDKEFKSKRNIRRHIEYTHLGMQRYKCVECETLFKEKRSLRKHVRMKHPNSAAFPQCHICEKRFESAKSCKIHLKLIHSFNMTTHPCHLCSVSFDSLEALNIHLTTNHSAEDEIYKCEECNLVFQGHEQFGQHCESFHSNLPSLKTCLPRCIICMKDFSSRKTLKRHIKKFHSDFNVDELATYGSRRRVFDVECDECIKNFNDDFYYGIYTKLKHLRDSVVFKCEYCKSSYNSLEFAIQRFKQCFDASQTKLYLSELCTTQMSDDMKSDSAEAMEPESTTVDVKLEPAEVSDESMTSDVKTEHDNIEMFDEFS